MEVRDPGWNNTDGKVLKSWSLRTEGQTACVASPEVHWWPVAFSVFAIARHLYDASPLTWWWRLIWWLLAVWKGPRRVWTSGYAIVPCRFNHVWNQTSMQHPLAGCMLVSLERCLCSCFMRGNNKQKKKSWRNNGAFIIIHQLELFLKEF